MIAIDTQSRTCKTCGGNQSDGVRFRRWGLTCNRCENRRCQERRDRLAATGLTPSRAMATPRQPLAKRWQEQAAACRTRAARYEADEPATAAALRDQAVLWERLRIGE